MSLRHFIRSACLALVVAPAGAGMELERPAEVVRVPVPQIVGSRAEVDTLLEKLADAAEPRVINVESGTDIADLLQREYGDAARYMWQFVVRANRKSKLYSTLRDAGPSLPPALKVSSHEETFVLPSGPYWLLRPSSIPVEGDDTIHSLAADYMGATNPTQLRKAEDLIRAANPGVDFNSLASQRSITVPQRMIAKGFVPTSEVFSFEEHPGFASEGTPENAPQTKGLLSCEPNVSSLDWKGVAEVLQANATIWSERRWTLQQPYVAVLDSGIDENEEARDRFQFWRGGPRAYLGIDVSEDENARDIPPWSSSFRTWKLRNHGTHVAGLVHGGTADVRRLLEPLSKLMILKVVSADRTAPDEAAIVKHQSLMAAFNWAEEYDASIVNLSVEPSAADKDMWGLERYRGLLFVVAAGNGMAGAIAGPQAVNVDATWLGPAGFGGHMSKNVVSVAAVDGNGRLASFSNFGRSSITLAAPGCGLDSYVAETSSGEGSAAAAATLAQPLSGTSQSTALVSAIAAILKSYGLSAAEIKFRLIASVDISPCGDGHCLQDRVFAGGILNPVKALRIYNDLVESNTGEIQLGKLSTSDPDPNTGEPLLCFKDPPRPCMNLSSVGKIASFQLQADGSYRARLFAGGQPTTAGFDVFEAALASDLILDDGSTKQTLNLENTRDIVFACRSL